MRWRIVLLLVLMAGAGLAAGWWLRERLAIDSCLDAGGRWEYRDSYCVGAVYGPMQE